MYLTKEYNDFIKSLEQCTSNMDISVVKPFTESEIQPNYSALLLDKLDLSNEFTVSNKSILRSMLVMDLLDCSFANRIELKYELFEKYFEKLAVNYSEDYFSLHSNKPNYDYSFLEDLNYFCEPSKEIILLNGYYFTLAYLYNQDIYADNLYEVLGPIQSRGKKYIVNRFHFTDIIDIVYYDESMKNGVIDMFGHSTFVFNNPKTCLLINGEIVYDKCIIQSKLDEAIELIKNIKPDYSIEKNINSRLQRYSDFINIKELKQQIDNLGDLRIFNRLSYKEQINLIKE